MAYNNPVQKKESACKQLKSETGKPSGLMMEGSLMHMSMVHQEETKKVEEAKAKKLDKEQEIKEIKSKATEYKPADNRGIAEMSPYKMEADSALHNNDPYSRAAANDKVFADAKRSKYSRRNPKHAGSNFFPPANPTPKKDLVKGKTADEDLGSYLYDSNQDGDSVFRDYNQDGTMLGRGIQSLIKKFKG